MPVRKVDTLPPGDPARRRDDEHGQHRRPAQAAPQALAPRPLPAACLDQARFVGCPGAHAAGSMLDRGEINAVQRRTLFACRPIGGALLEDARRPLARQVRGLEAPPHQGGQRVMGEAGRGALVGGDGREEVAVLALADQLHDFRTPTVARGDLRGLPRLGGAKGRRVVAEQVQRQPRIHQIRSH
jgi:hypothetical protein